MDPRLHQVIEHDDVDELHRLIVEDQKFLDRVSEDPFPNTLLHIAAAAGKIQVAMEVAILKPEFARKLDPEGYSPIHLALQHEHYQTARALITLDPELIQVRGRRGITPLHYVAGKEGDNELELLAEFLSVCRSSIEDLTSRCETAVHVAVKNHNLKAFKVLFGWLRRVCLTRILNWKDQDGNTVLHIAAFEGQTEIIKLLIGYTNVNVKNFQNRTALDIFQVNPHFDEAVASRLHPRSTSTLSLSQYFSSELSVFEKYSNFFGIQDEATRNMVLVVATLIATATYQAILSPLGGYWQDDSSNPPANSSSVITANSSGIAIEKPHQAGNIIITGSQLYSFAYLNGTAFVASIASIAVVAISLWPHTLIIYFSLTILSLAYCFFLVIEFPKSDRVVGTLLYEFFGMLLGTTLALPIPMWLRHIRVVSRVDATWRRLSNILGSKG
ncbi:ankyrin repeat-containing protein BDA1-like [Syzygium oleosum]|uniref:ankyrin repeat-containing protein BDA1-like n=1 Tax=Syzygium oleosum TaxID=219896 RepID=UPI0024BB8017|nr:ankyrin repeat-containing protein BDA1-like [Syzygium oleosum]